MSETLIDLYSEDLGNLNLETTTKNKIYELGNKIQNCFWDFNDNKCHEIGLSKVRNLFTFIMDYQPDLKRNQVKLFINNFNSINRVTPISGMILFNSDFTKVLLVRNYKSHSWSFPKGKLNIHQNETEMKCAIRECTEETSYDVKKTDIITKISSKICNRDTTFFLVKNSPTDFNYHCDNKYEIEEIGWHPFDSSLETKKYNIYINVLYKDIHRIVEDLKNSD